TSDPKVRGWYRFAAGVAADGADGRDDFEVTLAELPGHAGAARALEVALAAGDETAELAELYVERARAGGAWNACTAATLLAASGRVDEAIAQLERVPELVGDVDDAPMRVAARLARRLGALEQAAEILSGSDDDRDQAERAWLLHRLGQSRDALPIVLAITSDSTDGAPDPIANAARGAEIALAAGDTAFAVRLLGRVAELSSAPAVRAAYAERAADLSGAPATAPGAATSSGLGDLIVAAREHELAGDWSGAYAALTTWRELARDAAVRLAADARRRWLLADKLSGTDEAWELYRGLHEEDPDDREITERLASIATVRGEVSVAVRYLEELAGSATDPAEAARLRVRIARVHEEAGHASSARQAYLDALDHTPDSRDAVDGLRRVAVGEGDWPALVTVLEREAGTAPPERATELRAEIARVTEDRIGDLPVAMDRWRAVLEHAADHDEANVHLLGLAERLGEWGVFVETAESYVHRAPPEQRAALWRRIGVACQDQLGRDDAVRFFEEAVAASPPDLEAARRLEGLARVQGEWPQVVRTLELQAEAELDLDGKRAALVRAARIQVESLQDHDAAAATYRRILQLRADDEQALRFIGQHLFEQGAFDEALEIFERLDPVAEQDQDLEDFDTRIELSGFYFMFADLLAQRGEIDAALARYERALALNPTHLQSLEAVAPLYTDRRQWAKAERVYRQLLQLTGGQGDKLRVAATYTALGLVERELGATDKAYKRFAKALELHPHDVGALKGMALVLEDKQDWSNLLSVYNNIIYHATLPTDVIDAYMTKGRILDMHMQRQDKAAQHYQRSLDFDPAQPQAWLRLAELAARREDWPEAGDLADKGLDLPEAIVDPFRARLLLLRAAAWQGTGHPERAEDFLSRAAARDPAVVQELGAAPLGNLDQVRVRLRALAAGG
ncbi:MAG TPA: tetratricopeptide repeat protein, partial [Myxococcota bacterium]|nr:tetratricopeptide repeat protein [Myxococcota bacterium]